MRTHAGSTTPVTGSPSRRGGPEVIFPPEDLEELLDLALFVEGHTKPALLLGPDGEQVPLPVEIYSVLRNVVEGMRQGNAIVVAPKGMMLTTQEAADFLSVSRPTLVKLLEDGAVPFERPGRHRRVRLSDLLRFQHERRAERRSTLNRMTEEASELGLYDGVQSDYVEASKAVRRSRSKGRPGS